MLRRSWSGLSALSVSCVLFMVGVTASAVATEPPAATPAAAAPTRFGDVSVQRLRNADKEPDQWLSNGRDANAAFYSPIAQINTGNASHLGFAWQYKTDTYRGLEGTPLVIDGVMYLSGNWGKVYALDATNGKALWTFDPHTDALFAKWALVDVITRSLAVWKGRVYTVGTDCKLSALDAHSGQLLWQTSTLADEKAGGYACDGAPQVAGKVVVVGNSGGENVGGGGSRGYVTAVDADSGKVAWRFYTVPALGEKNPSEEMQHAAATWDPKRNPAFGGGGNAWGIMTYDPDLDLLYFGTGNAAPWNGHRDWTGGKSTDRLYAASIIALKAGTGRMAWYYQTTPGDVWDYDATMNLVLADLKVKGTSRRVLMQANKNGYFYVIDRATGEPLSAKAFVYMNWSSGVDGSFRPIVNAAVANYDASPKIVYPSAVGAHSWQPMSYSPASGLVYIPAIETGNIMIDVRKNPGATLTDVDGQSGIELLFPDPSLSYEFWHPMVGDVPHFAATPPDGPKPALRSVLVAWDPIAGRRVWEKQTSKDFLVMDGGALSTGGGVVFAGREDGTFVTYDAKTGDILKVLETGTPIMAAPMTYQIAGRQYVAVLSGHGGQYMTFLGTSALKYINEGRVLVFALDAAPEVPKPEVRPTVPLGPPPPRAGTAALVSAGRNLFFNNCAKCHTLGAPGITPDLTRSGIVASEDSFKAVLLKGALMPMGMPRFDDKLTVADVKALRSFFIDQWWQTYTADHASEPKH